MESTELISLSLLKHAPVLDARINMEIRPLAPLSMISEMPGSFYKTLRYPSKKMICGLIENMLGWHFDRILRKHIFNDWKKVMKKYGKSVNIKEYQHGSTYIPLLMDYFELSEKPSLIDFKSICTYTDLWTKCYRRDDSSKHLNGCKNLDDSLIAEKQAFFSNVERLKKEAEKIKKAKDVSNADKTRIAVKAETAKKEKESWFQEHIGQIPCFYTTPTNREYIDLDAIYNIPLEIDSNLSHILEHACNGICYLGNSEGWIHINFKTVEQ